MREKITVQVFAKKNYLMDKTFKKGWQEENQTKGNYRKIFDTYMSYIFSPGKGCIIIHNN